MLISLKKVLEEENWVSRRVISTDSDDISFFFKFVLEHKTKCSFCFEQETKVSTLRIARVNFSDNTF